MLRAHEESLIKQDRAIFWYVQNKEFLEIKVRKQVFWNGTILDYRQKKGFCSKSTQVNSRVDCKAYFWNNGTKLNFYRIS